MRVGFVNSIGKTKSSRVDLKRNSYADNSIRPQLTKDTFTPSFRGEYLFSDEHFTPQNVSLLQSIAEGDIAGMEKSMNRGANPNLKYTLREGGQLYELTPLHMATSNQNQTAVKLLVERGAAINVMDNFGQSPLHIASISKSFGISDFLLKNNPLYKLENMRMEDYMGMTPIHRSAEHLDPNILELFINNGGTMTASNSKGFSPFKVMVVALKNAFESSSQAEAFEKFVSPGIKQGVDLLGSGKLSVESFDRGCVELLRNVLKV